MIIMHRASFDIGKKQKALTSGKANIAGKVNN